MSDTRPDMDLLALAGATKTGLRDIDQNSMGGSPHADKIDINAMAGVHNRPRTVSGNRPNLLNNMDFVEMPKSRPLGQVSMEGQPLPERPVDFARIPESIQGNVDHLLEHVSHEEVPSESDRHSAPTNEPIPTPQLDPDMNLDLFQFSVVKELVNNLDSTIGSIEETLNNLKTKRDEIMNILKGNTP